MCVFTYNIHTFKTWIKKIGRQHFCRSGNGFGLGMFLAFSAMDFGLKDHKQAYRGGSDSAVGWRAKGNQLKGRSLCMLDANDVSSPACPESLRADQ